MKKQYIEPTIQTVCIRQNGLLAGSTRTLGLGTNPTELDTEKLSFDDEEFDGIFGD